MNYHRANNHIYTTWFKIYDIITSLFVFIFFHLSMNPQASLFNSACFSKQGSCSRHFSVTGFFHSTLFLTLDCDFLNDVWLAWSVHFRWKAEKSCNVQHYYWLYSKISNTQKTKQKLFSVVGKVYSCDCVNNNLEMACHLPLYPHFSFKSFRELTVLTQLP